MNTATEEVVGLVLGALHPRLRERCSEAKIISVLVCARARLCCHGQISRACGAHQGAVSPYALETAHLEASQPVSNMTLRNWAKFQH